MSKNTSVKKTSCRRRIYGDELKAEAVQMLLDGHRAESVVKNLGLTGTSLLYQWKAKISSREWTSGDQLGDSCATVGGGTSTGRTRARYFKKSLVDFQPADVKQVYPVVRRLREEGFALDALCESLSISRSAYYVWEGGEKNSRQRQDEHMDAVGASNLPGTPATLWRASDRGGVVSSWRPLWGEARWTSDARDGACGDSTSHLSAKNDEQPSHVGLQRQLANRRVAADRAQSSVGRRHYVHSFKSRRFSLPGDAYGPLFPTNCRLVAAGSYGRVAGALRVAYGDYGSPAREGPGASHRPRRTVRGQELSTGAGARPDGAKHERRRQLLRQRVHGVVLWDDQNGVADDGIQKCGNRPQGNQRWCGFSASPRHR